MTDVTTTALRGIAKTLDDVVASAIPSDDPLAFQELKLVVRYLGFARERVDHLYARARYELQAYGDLIGEVAAILSAVDPERAWASSDLRARSDAMLALPGAAIGELRRLCEDIASTISSTLTEVSDLGTIQRLERAVVLGSAEVIAFDRSWYAPLKLERFPDQVRLLNSFIPL